MSEGDVAILVACFSAAVALGIGVPQILGLMQQNRTAAFDQRFEAFIAVQEALQRTCVSTQQPEIGDIISLNNAIQRCWFLFPTSISHHLDQARGNILQMRVLHAEIWDTGGIPLGASNDTLRRFHDAQRAAVNVWANLREIFRPHMNLDFWQGPHPLSWIDDFLDWLERR